MAGCHGKFSSLRFSIYLNVTELIVRLRRFSAEKPVLFTGSLRVISAIESRGKSASLEQTCLSLRVRFSHALFADEGRNTRRFLLISFVCYSPSPIECKASPSVGVCAYN